MTPWIFLTLGLIVAIGAIKLALMWKLAHAETPADAHDVTPMSNRRAWQFALVLVALVFVTVGYSDMSLWFLPLVVYVAIWVPQVSRKAATSGQAIYVGAAFGTAMVAATLLQIFVLAD